MGGIGGIITYLGWWNRREGRNPRICESNPAPVRVPRSKKHGAGAVGDLGRGRGWGWRALCRQAGRWDGIALQGEKKKKTTTTTRRRWRRKTTMAWRGSGGGPDRNRDAASVSTPPPRPHSSWADPTTHTPFTVVHRLVIYPTWAQSRWPIIVQAHHALCDCHVGPSTTWTYSLLSFLLSLVNGQPSTSQLHTLLLYFWDYIFPCFSTLMWTVEDSHVVRTYFMPDFYYFLKKLYRKILRTACMN